MSALRRFASGAGLQLVRGLCARPAVADAASAAGSVSGNSRLGFHHQQGPGKFVSCQDNPMWRGLSSSSSEDKPRDAPTGVPEAGSSSSESHDGKESAQQGAASSDTEAQGSDRSEDVDKCMEIIRSVRRDGANLRYKQGASWFTIALGELLMWVTSNLSVHALSRLDKEFVEEEFLDSAIDAFYMVNSLFTEADFPTLAPMLAPAMLTKFKKVHSEAHELGLKFNLDVLDVEGAQLLDVYYNTQDLMEVLKPDLAKNLPGGAASPEEAVKRATEISEAASDVEGGAATLPVQVPFWLVVRVRIVSTEKWAISRLSGDKARLKETTEEHDNVWVFARGPITVKMPLPKPGEKPSPPVPEGVEKLPWFLLSTRG